MRKTKAPTLRSKHFKGLQTQLTAAGLIFSANIGPQDREAACPEIGETYGDTAGYLDRLAASRGFTRIVLNPTRPSGQTLLSLMKAAQSSAMPNEQIDVGGGLDGSYDRKWKREISSGTDSEGQSLVLVAYDKGRPVGYAGLSVSLLHPVADQNEDYFLSFMLDLVYVIPQCRGRGYGLDLSVAVGLLCGDILVATYNAVPVGSEISPHIRADYESEGGEAIACHARDSLDFGRDMLRESGRRKTIRIEAVVLDAGY